MTNLKCSACGAELLAGTNFCRKCGSPGSAAQGMTGSEEPTALFGPATDKVTTQRLDPRPTSPDPARRLHPDSVGTSSQEGRQSQLGVMRGLILLMFVLGIITVVAVVKLRNNRTTVQTVNQTAAANNLRYPGAQIIVDMTNTDGSRTIQLETSDPLDRVESWYQSNLQLTKTVRLTSSSVVMKNDKITITLANDDKKTAILIKQTT